jgi:hypothetical protein
VAGLAWHVGLGDVDFVDRRIRQGVGVENVVAGAMQVAVDRGPVDQDAKDPLLDDREGIVDGRAEHVGQLLGGGLLRLGGPSAGVVVELRLAEPLVVATGGCKGRGRGQLPPSPEPPRTTGSTRPVGTWSHGLPSLISSNSLRTFMASPVVSRPG